MTRPVDSSKEARRGGTVKYMVFSDPLTFDPYVQTGTARTDRYVFDGLVRIEPGHLKGSENNIVPAVAESWEFSPDRLAITLKLRPGVKWHNSAPLNGRAFEADDVLVTWQRIVASGRRRAEVVNSVNANAPIVSLTALDPRTISVKLAYPIYFGLNILADTGKLPLIPKESASGLELRRDPIGTGPFMLAKYEPSVAITMKRNPDFYEKDWPLVEQLDMPMVSEYAAQLSHLRAGNLYTLNGPVQQSDVLPTKKDITELNVYAGDWSSPNFRTAFGWESSTQSPWLDQRVRQAYSLTWDRDLWLGALYDVEAFDSQGLVMATRWRRFGKAIG